VQIVSVFSGLVVSVGEDWAVGDLFDVGCGSIDGVCVSVGSQVSGLQAVIIKIKMRKDKWNRNKLFCFFIQIPILYRYQSIFHIRI
jgi:hypothetical protein